MKTFIILLLTLLISQTTLIACNCRTIELKLARSYEYSGSDFIFIGKVLNFNDTIGTAKIRIKEIFKGDLSNDSTIEISYPNSCEPYIDSIGDWLIYASYNNSTLHLNVCGLSRSLSKPENNRYFQSFIPPPPPPSNDSIIKRDKNSSSPSFLELKKKNRMEAKRLLEKEILELRNKKTKPNKIYKQ